MTRGPKLQPLVLTDAEIAQLTAWSRRPKTARALAERATIVLGCATGASHADVAAACGVYRNTVAKWRTRFLAQRLDGLLDAPRPGAPRTITDGDVERVIRKTLEERPPADAATHWSTRTMARAAGVTQTAVVRIWHAYGLQPHREETFKLSTDPLFIDKVRDVVGLYLQPPERALVLCRESRARRARTMRIACSLAGALGRHAVLAGTSHGSPKHAPGSGCGTDPAALVVGARGTSMAGFLAPRPYAPRGDFRGRSAAGVGEPARRSGGPQRVGHAYPHQHPRRGHCCALTA